MKMPSSAASACGRNREESMAGPSSMSGARFSGAQSGIIELIMVRIREGGLGMGCESGRDDERRLGGAAESDRMWSSEARDGTPVYCDLRKRGGRGLPRFLPHLAGVPYAKRDGRGRS